MGKLPRKRIRKQPRTRHGVELEPSYTTWAGMRTRCHNPNSPSYKNYGARGIYVCERWRNSYAAFREDMGQRPPGLSLHRVDNDGPYSPENCVWADRHTQARVKRTSKMVWCQGKKMPLADACDLMGLDYDKVTHRLHRGLTFEQAIRRIRDYETHMSGVTPAIRMCMRCYRDLPLTEFYKMRLGLWGRADKCKKCLGVPAEQQRPKASVDVGGERITIWKLAEREGVPYYSVRWRMRTKGMTAFEAIADFRASQTPRPIEATRTCPVCEVEKAITDFPIHPQGIQGRRSTCRPCTNAQARHNYRQARIRQGLQVRAASGS